MKNLLYVLIASFASASAAWAQVPPLSIPDAAAVAEAIQQDTDVKAILSALEKARSVKCTDLSPTNLTAMSPVEPNGSALYSARFFCQDLKIPSNPAEVFQFTVEADWVREVVGYATNLTGVEIDPVQ